MESINLRTLWQQADADQVFRQIHGLLTDLEQGKWVQDCKTFSCGFRITHTSFPKHDLGDGHVKSLSTSSLPFLCKALMPSNHKVSTYSGRQVIDNQGLDVDFSLYISFCRRVCLTAGDERRVTGVRRSTRRKNCAVTRPL